VDTGSCEENASKQEAEASVLIQSEPGLCDGRYLAASVVSRLLPFYQIAQSESLGALAALLGEHRQLLVEAARDLLLEVFDMAPLAPVKLGRLHRHAVCLIGFLVGPSPAAPYHAAVTIQAKEIISPFFVIGVIDSANGSIGRLK
jgi:hypothetical protein